MSFVEKLKTAFNSRRFLLALAGVLTVLLNEHLGLSQECAMQLSAIIIAWIVGDSLRETK